MLLVILVFALFASTFTLAKLALCYASPIFFIGARMILAGALLLSYAYHKGISLRIAHSDRLLFGMVALCHIYIAYLFEFWALQFVQPTKASLIYNMSPFFTAIMVYIVFGKKITYTQIAGLIVGFLGLLPIIMGPGCAEGGTFFLVSLPEAALIMAVLASAIGWLAVKKLVDRGYVPFFVNGSGMLAGGIGAMATALLFEHPAGYIVEFWPFVGYMVALILIANIICYNLYGYLLKIYSPTFLAFAGFITPLFTALFDMLFLQAPITWHFFASLILVTGGLYLYYFDE